MLIVRGQRERCLFFQWLAQRGAVELARGARLWAKHLWTHCLLEYCMLEVQLLVELPRRVRTAAVSLSLKTCSRNRKASIIMLSEDLHRPQCRRLISSWYGSVLTAPFRQCASVRRLALGPKRLGNFTMSVLVILNGTMRSRSVFEGSRILPLSRRLMDQMLALHGNAQFASAATLDRSGHG